MRSFLSAILLLLSATLCRGDGFPNYGYRIANTPLYIGGYVSALYDEKELDDDILFDDIALLFYANIEKYHFLGEIEAADIPLRGGKNSDIRIYVERLQLNYDFNDNTTVTLGKFNSDIGFWNLAPINTLTDTTTSPYLMENTFPELTTGLMVTKSFWDEEQLFSVTAQNNPDLDRNYNNMKTDRHYAFGYTYADYATTWRINGGYFHEKHRGDAYYGGISYRNESSRWTIQSELFHKTQNNHRTIPYNFYLQLTRHMTDRHDLVFRQEFYKDHSIATKEAISLVGFTYRPHPSLTFKTEYIRHSVLPLNRIVFSCSMVF